MPSNIKTGLVKSLVPILLLAAILINAPCVYAQTADRQVANRALNLIAAAQAEYHKAHGEYTSSLDELSAYIDGDVQNRKLRLSILEANKTSFIAQAKMRNSARAWIYDSSKGSVQDKPDGTGDGQSQ